MVVFGVGVLESGTYSKVRPVIRERTTGQWERVQEDKICFSTDPFEFKFIIVPSSDETYVAFCYPYLYKDLKGFINKYSGPYLDFNIIGKSNEGRDFPMLFLGNPNDEKEKKLVVCLARQHAGEVSGSYILEGVMDAFLSDTKFGKDMRIKLY